MVKLCPEISCSPGAETWEPQRQKKSKVAPPTYAWSMKGAVFLGLLRVQSLHPLGLQNHRTHWLHADNRVYGTEFDLCFPVPREVGQVPIMPGPLAAFAESAAHYQKNNIIKTCKLWNPQFNLVILAVCFIARPVAAPPVLFLSLCFPLTG